MNANVFAYGSNMCSGRLADYKVVPLAEGLPALLRDYRLSFDKLSSDESGKANVRPKAGAEVWGVLYTITAHDLRILDDGEVGYHRIRICAETTDGQIQSAWVYIATQTVLDTELRPYTWYKRFLVEGAKQHHLPEEYVRALELISADADKNSHRDVQKRNLRCE